MVYKNAEFISELGNIKSILPKLEFRHLFSMLNNGVTPIRAVSDVAIKFYLQFILGPGIIYELGAPTNYYQKFVPEGQRYQITDFSHKSPMPVDVTAMPFTDCSVDALFSSFALEHVKNYQKAISEMKRVLKPGGRLLLVVPNIYYYHGAPDDYVRFTASYLKELFDDMRVHIILPLGTRGLCIAEFLDERNFTPAYSIQPLRWLYKLLATMLVLKYIIKPKSMPGFESATLLLAEKTPTESLVSPRDENIICQTSKTE